MPPSLTETSPEVSVIIPAFNGERSIRQCIQSVLTSSFPAAKMEVVCVDNGSTDRTLSILDEFTDRVKVAHAATRGAAAARNAGIRIARGEFIAFTDADCVVHPEWLTHIIQPLRTGAAGATGGRVLSRPGAGAVERFGELIHDHRNAIECDRPPYIISMNMACRRDTLLSVNGFDERWLRSQDVDLSYRLVESGVSFAYCPQAVIYHHNRDTVPALLREAFTHGRYRPAFLRVHRRFLREYKAKMSAAPPPSPYPAETPNPRLSGLQRGILWRVFKAAKKLGELKGRWNPPVSIP